MDVAATAQPPSRGRTPVPDWNGQPADEPVSTPQRAGDADNKFQKAIAAWRNIDFAHLIPSLDTTASDLVAHQRDALVERKELAQKTKDFRKLEDSAKLVEVKSLLKAYQSYIDLVTNQSKTVQSSFLQVYSSLSEAPDPYPLLEASVDSLVVADEVVPKLEADNKHLQSQLSKTTSQLEETESRLEKETKTRQALEQQGDAKVKEVQKTWTAVLAEKQDNWEAREKNLEERAEHQERLLKELKASYEVSARLDRGEDGDTQAHTGASAAELEMMSSDLDRVNLRLAEVEARNEQLRLELAQSATQKGVSSKSVPVEDDPAYLRLRSENSTLMRKADGARHERESAQREHENNVRNLKRDITGLKEDRDSLRAKVAKWQDYEDVKRELDVLKSIEFSTGDADEAGADSEAQGGQGSKDGGGLEQLLLARNKKLNNELTVLRVSHQDLAGRLETLQDELSSANMELERSRTLTATLEDDLSRMQEHSSSGAAMSVAGTHVSRYPASSYGRRGRASPTSSIISGIDGTQPHTSGTLDSLRAGDSQGPGILPMVTAQRDRFKKRTTNLEAELSRTHTTVSALRSEVASLQKDNLSLYEKTRYVSTYAARAPAAAGVNPNPSSVAIGGASSPAAAAPLDRYRSEYESRISPFAAFRGRETQWAFKRMSLPERGFLQVTKVVLANRVSRNVFAVYLLGLHVAIVMVLYTGAGAAEVPAKPLAVAAGT